MTNREGYPSIWYCRVVSLRCTVDSETIIFGYKSKKITEVNTLMIGCTDDEEASSDETEE